MQGLSSRYRLGCDHGRGRIRNSTAADPDRRAADFLLDRCGLGTATAK